MFKVSECFLPRPIGFLGVRVVGDWRIKVYSIVYGESPFDSTRFERALQRFSDALPMPASTHTRPGVGFAIMHQGRGADYLVLCWWDNENELPMRVYVNTRDAEGWRTARESESVCVWDIQVINAERDVYVATMLGPAGPSTDGYLMHHASPRD